MAWATTRRSASSQSRPQSWQTPCRDMLMITAPTRWACCTSGSARCFCSCRPHQTTRCSAT
ncbi:hypothetical protein GBAR_LOCUS16444 [Geodia barretti]|uniref:Uncharacterized protein n=1 Tax=Geodia barretti TaxID=519541 RepID=A0AA35SFA0_GEOBA|nr:hypothetical protein GBAR_LOCUS16444 [Geodia barretti]